MKKRIGSTISILLTVALLAGCGGNVATGDEKNNGSNDAAQNTATEASNTGSSAEAAKPVSSSTHEVTEQTYPLYYQEATNKSEITLYFIDGTDIPYVSMEEALAMVSRSNYNQDLYELKYENDHAVMLRKNTSFDADFDFTNDTITFFDYNAFLRIEGSSLIDAFEPGSTDAAPVFKQVYANERYGKVLTFDLAAYDIDLIREGDGWYVPLQTVSDVFLSHYMDYVLFNTESVIIGNHSFDFGSDLDRIYYSATGTVSEELALFSYNELCMALDHLYGLKKNHNIDSFDTYFFEVGIRKRLMGTDSVQSDWALMELINHGFDDLHSSYLAPSYTTDQAAFKEIMPETGPWRKHFNSSIALFAETRAEAFPDGVPPYQEIGNTAYITFDHFIIEEEGIDYLSDPKEEELSDTVRLIQYSCDQILRPDSPIENVVMDLSNNTGGMADAAAYVIASYLGRGELDIADTLTGATTTDQFFIDTNRDGNFDVDDALAEKGFNLYCLISPVSFSCGNLVPNVFKKSPNVTLLGQTSGGGTCSVFTLSTARGSVFQMSSPYSLSMFMNGSFYDIDKGAEPDIYIAKVKDFYDRESLTKMINDIY